MFFIVWNIKSQVVSQLQGPLCLFSFLKHLVCSSLDILISPQHVSFLYLVIALVHLNFRLAPVPSWLPCPLTTSWHISTAVPTANYTVHSTFPISSSPQESGSLCSYSWARPNHRVLANPWTSCHWFCPGEAPPGPCESALAQKVWMSPFLSEGKSGLCPPSSL